MVGCGCRDREIYVLRQNDDDNDNDDNNNKSQESPKSLIQGIPKTNPKPIILAHAHTPIVIMLTSTKLRACAVE